MRLLLALLVLVVGCESGKPAPQTSDESFPTITIGLNQKRLELPFAVVECVEKPDETTVRLLALTKEAVDEPPMLMLARLHQDRVHDAHVWIPKGALRHAEELPWVQLIAADVPGGRKPDCRVERPDGSMTIICNDATPVPWTEPGPIPDVSFKATLTCP